MEVLTDVGYVSGYSFDEKGRLVPVVDSVEEGNRMQVTADKPTGGGIPLTVGWEITRVDPDREVGVELVSFADNPRGEKQEARLRLPKVRVQKLKTSISAPEGTGIGLASFRAMHREDRATGIPLLRSIPLVGGLFGGSRSVSVEQGLRTLGHLASADPIPEGGGDAAPNVRLHLRLLEWAPGADGAAPSAVGPQLGEEQVRVLTEQWRRAPEASCYEEEVLVSQSGSFEIADHEDVTYVSGVKQDDQGRATPAVDTCREGLALKGTLRAEGGARTVLEFSVERSRVLSMEKKMASLVSRAPDGRPGPTVQIPISLPSLSSLDHRGFLVLSPGVPSGILLSSLASSRGDRFAMLAVTAEPVPGGPADSDALAAERPTAGGQPDG